ncbi:dolichyl-P-Man:Man(5)GlcNAc(2)-PP-dolichol alpha-1,3-mannosyltransferase [Oleoguttula sp. CCFEE 5521]
MQQIETYIAGERDYGKISGSTGPLVYPGGHVYIYRLLYALTDKGKDIRLAQYAFIVLYLGTLTLAIAAYRRANAPPWLLPMLVLSKRMHSIFMLRLFNDGFAVAFFFAAVLAYQKRWWTVGSLLFSAGLGVKMSLLLVLPAVGLILMLAIGRDRAVKQAVLMMQVQAMLGYEFIVEDVYSYFGRAFELSRQFFFKWTVNWRFVGEETFLSRNFSLGLLAAHGGLLVTFLGTRWLKPARITLSGLEWMLLEPPRGAAQAKIARSVTPDFVFSVVASAMLIGCLCARSLHYQFFAYIAWLTPYVLWRSGLHPVAVYAVWAAQEWAWNVYPSTDTSSVVVVGCLAASVLASWFAIGRTEGVKLAIKDPDLHVE